jgi:hypothetical protein
MVEEGDRLNLKKVNQPQRKRDDENGRKPKTNRAKGQFVSGRSYRRTLLFGCLVRSRPPFLVRVSNQDFHELPVNTEFWNCKPLLSGSTLPKAV